jgi:protein TonB
MEPDDSPLVVASRPLLRRAERTEELDEPTTEQPLEKPPKPELPPRQPTPQPEVEMASVDSLGSPASQAMEGAVVDEPPRAAVNPAPQFPEEARAAGQQGVVVLLVRVASDGSVERVSVETTSGFPLLDAAATEGVKRWRFQPARRAGVPVTYDVPVPIRFTIRRS